MPVTIHKDKQAVRSALSWEVFHKTGKAGKRSLSRETTYYFFVPLHPRADGVTQDRHAFLNTQRLGESKVPPVGVLQPMGSRCAAQEVRADLRPQVTGDRDVLRLSERRGSSQPVTPPIFITSGMT